jgi:single-strand DNA-binding protein
MLIGNLTRDPELRYTPSGSPVATFSVATNRSWLPEGAQERREETEFHRIVAWSKLAELCSQLLYKGVKVFVEGRLQTRNWTGQYGVAHTTTEIVIDDMIILDKKGDRELRAQAHAAADAAAQQSTVNNQQLTNNMQPVANSTQPTTGSTKQTATDDKQKPEKEEKKEPEKKEEVKEAVKDESVAPEDIPF